MQILVGIVSETKFHFTTSILQYGSITRYTKGLGF